MDHKKKAKYVLNKFCVHSQAAIILFLCTLITIRKKLTCESNPRVITHIGVILGGPEGAQAPSLFALEMH